ncbi:MAG: response regulator [Pirellulaceae bacterium]|nr:response regulator [Pirellulaceae bacterium]
MQDVNGETVVLHEPLCLVRDWLEAGRDNPENYAAAIRELRTIGDSAEDAGRGDIARFVNQLANLTEIAVLSTDDSAMGSESAEILTYVDDSLSLLQQAFDDVDDLGEPLDKRLSEGVQRWGECLQVFNEQQNEAESWQPSAKTTDFDPRSENDQVNDDIGMILTSLSELTSASTAQVASDEVQGQEEAKEFLSQLATESVESVSGEERSSLNDDVILEGEIKEAYLDDAQRCLASIESSLLAFENSPNPQPLNQVCRELHTLKGASASVGLVKLAAFLHHVEDDLQASCDRSDGQIDVDPILQGVDLVRQQISLVAPETTSVPVETKNGKDQSPKPGTPSGKRPAAFSDSTASSKDSVRVKSAQLDRLMDMLAELVMLRNRRECRVEQLKEINTELVACVSRLRAFEEDCPPAASLNSLTIDPIEYRSKKPRRRKVSSLTEVANDLLDLGRNLRELYEPVGDENRAISRFIRQFRQELVQLRRVPVGGLFARLQRAARDAAKKENKQVALQLVGEDVGLERSIQEQLYDALLHIVRNAVSHGIETESQRIALGKNPSGTLRLEANGGSNLLVITVRDDGRGLDYDALRRRGVEMGLIASDRVATRSELARLIFHPGFSTKTETTELSGRGVGMDVVATTLEELQSWIEVESEPGQGTIIRLLIPLHSVIEHVMVFRSGNQEFAVPTQFVKAAGPWVPEQSQDFPLIPFSSVCPNTRSQDLNQSQLIVIAHGWEVTDSDNESDSTQRIERRIGLLVDEIVGPEEVVVRPLPSLLKDQRMFGGVTLSGTGDIMLLFDGQHLLQRSLMVSREGSTLDPSHFSKNRSSTECKRALVVDDSRSSRRALIQLLDSDHYLIDEASDGLEAVKLLNQQAYDIIFTDLEMPQMSGFDLLREIRSREIYEMTPVLMVSSRDEEVFKDKARNLGVTDYLTKPVSEKQINGALCRLQEPN